MFLRFLFITMRLVNPEVFANELPRAQHASTSALVLLKKNPRKLFVQAAGDSQALLRCLREVPLNALVSVPVKGLEFAPAFGPSIDGVVIDPGDPDDQDFTLQVDTINTLNNILLRKDVISKLSRYFPASYSPHFLNFPRFRFSPFSFFLPLFLFLDVSFLNTISSAIT